MNIMQIVSAGDINGAVVHCALLTRELVRRGHNLTMVCKPHAWSGKRVADLPVEVIHSDLSRWPLDELRRVGKIARERGIDVIHTHMSRAHAFGVMLKMRLGVPCIATAHNRYVQLHWMFNDFVIGTSDATTRFHRRYNLVRRARSRTIHNFIDEAAVLNVPAGTRDGMRRSFGVRDEHVLVAQIGDVIPRKGLLYLVRALPQVLAAAPNVRLLAVGDPKGTEAYLSQIKSEARSLGVADAIHFAGSRRDIPDVLAAIDVLALASLEESMPLSILEAMAAGKPVIATHVGGIPDCVAHDESGLLVPPADVNALGAAIVRLANGRSVRVKLGDYGRNRVADGFSTAAIGQRIEAVYEEITLKRGRRAA